MRFPLAMSGPGGALVAASDSNSLIWWDWVGRHLDDVGTALTRHIELTGFAVGVGLLVSTPLALLARRHRALAGPILAVSGVLYGQ